MHDLNWTNQPHCFERDQPEPCPCFLVIHTTKHNLKIEQMRGDALKERKCKAAAVKKMFCVDTGGINFDEDQINC